MRRRSHLRTYAECSIICTMKFIPICLVICATLCHTGCFSVDTALIKEENAEHVVMNNYGWKLFDWIPLFCGNAEEDSSTSFVLFRDDVTVDKMQARFARYAAGREIVCPVYDMNDSKFLYVFGIPIPYIITYDEITLSGTLK